MFKINIDKFSQIVQFSTKPENRTLMKNMTVLMKAQFYLQEVGDTYLNMTKFNKGYVWINGHNLGRYWSVGPQYKLFCPGVWLSNTTKNELYVLQMMHDEEKERSIRGELTLQED